MLENCPSILPNDVELRTPPSTPTPSFVAFCDGGIRTPPPEPTIVAPSTPTLDGAPHSPPKTPGTPPTPPQTLPLPPPLSLPPVPRVPRSVPAPPVKEVRPTSRAGPARGTREGRTLQPIPERLSAHISRVARDRVKKARSRPLGTFNRDPRSSRFHCPTCRVTCTGRVQYFEHIRSARHQTKVNPIIHRCASCEITVYSTQDYNRHLHSRRHRSRAQVFSK